MGNIAFMKILGYVDLPRHDARRPRSPSPPAWTSSTPCRCGGNFIGLRQHAADQQATGSSFTGRRQRTPARYAKGGVAVVISKSEQKVAFIDLKPLFSHYQRHVLRQRPTCSATSNLGMADNQWPLHLRQHAAADADGDQDGGAAEPSRRRSRPPCGAAGKRAWVATQDGTLRIYSLGGYAPGGTAAPAASAIAEVGTVAGIGRNPTSLAHLQGRARRRSIDADSTSR